MITAVTKAKKNLALAALAVVILCASAGAAAAAALAQSDVPEYGLPGLYVPAFPGAGVSTEALVGDYCASVEPGEAGVYTLRCYADEHSPQAPVSIDTATDAEIDARVAAETAPIAENTVAITANRSAIDDHKADRSVHGGGGSGAVLSDQRPQALGTAVAGAGTAASRHDHVHPTTGLATDADLSGKLDTDLGNVASLSGNAKAAFRAALLPVLQDGQVMAGPNYAATSLSLVTAAQLNSRRPSTTAAASGLSITITPPSTGAQYLLELRGGTITAGRNGQDATVSIRRGNTTVSEVEYEVNNTDKVNLTQAVIVTPGTTSPVTYSVWWVRTNNANVLVSALNPMVLTATRLN